MTPTINAIGFSLTEANLELLNTKLERISYANDLIVDLIVHVRHENSFSVESTVNFKWGASAHVSAEDADYAAAVNKMMDVLDNKIKKEKDKYQGR